jgi:hypothetical protein
MSYFLIGETRADERPLFVLWTRDASGVSVLPIGSHDRRDMQAVGRRLIEDTSGVDAHEMLESIVDSQRADGRPLQLVDLADPEREAIAWSIEMDFFLTDHDETPSASRYTSA